MTFVRCGGRNLADGLAANGRCEIVRRPMKKPASMQAGGLKPLMNRQPAARQKWQAGHESAWCTLLWFQEQIQGPENAPVARFDGLCCYQTGSETGAGLRSAGGCKIRPAHAALNKCLPPLTATPATGVSCFQTMTNEAPAPRPASQPGPRSGPSAARRTHPLLARLAQWHPGLFGSLDRKSVV